MKTRSIEPENRSPFSYNLKKCEIGGERMSGSIELSAVSIEIKLFENINNPFISGEIAILDNDDLMNRIGFSGTEKLLIEIETEFANIRKNFIVTEVINTLSTNGKDKVILLQVLEDISFLSKLIRVSKSYSGSPDIIIKNILKEHLNRDMFNISSQNHNDGPMKIIVPNLTPLGACEWIQRRAVTKSGMPFYLFSTLADDKIRYVDLETILTSKPLNALNSPYFYNQGIANNNLDENGQSFIINDTAQSNAENTIMLCQLGFMSSTYTHIDTVKGSKLENKHIMADVLKDLKSSVFKSGQKELVIDTTNTFNSKKIQEYDTRQITRITPTNSYENEYKNYSEANDVSAHMLKAKAISLRGVLNKSSIDISVAGRNFCQTNKNVSIGNTINLDFSRMLEFEKEIQHDPKKSGTYMIHAVRHVFSGPKYMATVGCSRLSQKTPERG
jgi:hypothetical protein